MLSTGFQVLIVPSSAEPSRVAEATALNDQGVRHWQAGRRSDAVAAFGRAMQLDARFAVPWHNRGAVFLIEGQFARAIDDLAHAVGLAPVWTLPRTHLAQAYLRAGETRQALVTSDAARALDPSLPDVRIDLRAVLLARAELARRVAARRRTFFLITLAVAILITLLTAGIGFATLALPIYRFALFHEAARQRDAALHELGELDGALAGRPLPILPASAAPLAAPPVRPSNDGPYVSVGLLPAHSIARIEPLMPMGTGYRRAGWALLLSSLFFTVTGIGAIFVSAGIPLDPTNSGLSTMVEGGVLSLVGVICLVLACICVGSALLVGAVAAFRRGRAGWGVAILTIGVLGIICALLPAQLMVLLYLLVMPSKARGAAIRE